MAQHGSKHSSRLETEEADVPLTEHHPTCLGGEKRLPQQGLMEVKKYTQEG